MVATADPRVEPRGIRAMATDPVLLGVLGLAVLLPLHRYWVADVLASLLAVTIPGAVLLRLGRFARSSRDLRVIYVPALSCFVLVAVGLAVDLIGPLLGAKAPLHGELIGIVVIIVCLLMWAAGRRRTEAAHRGEIVRLLPQLWPLLLPALTAAGALVLNNTHSSVPADVGAALVPCVLVLTLLGSSRLSSSQVAILLFACALALLWAYTLRSQEVLGFDISTESEIARHTHALGVWHTSHRNDAYGAMLSLTILPSALTSIGGISWLLSFKLLYPCAAALLPVAVYLLGERHVGRPYAAGAASLLVVQSYFFQQLPGLARQEIGLLFFAALVLAVLDRDEARPRALVLVALFGVGLVISHYSSTYVALLLLPIALVLELILSRREVLAGIAPAILVGLVALAGGAALWYGAVTHSASNVTQLVRTVRQEGIALFPRNAAGASGGYFTENEIETVPAKRYEALVAREYRRTRPYVHPLPAAHERRYALRSARVPAPRVRSPSAQAALSDLQIAVSELVLIFAGLGTLLGLLLGRFGLRRVAVLALGTIGMLFLFRFSGTLSAFYNQSRALLQSLILLAVPAAFLAETLCTRVRRLYVGAAVPVLFALALGVTAAQQDGVTTLLAGGGRPVTLANAGEDYERFYMTPAELSGASWAYGATRDVDLYADRYGQLRLAAATGAVGLDGVTPVTLDRHAWLYGTHTNVVLGRARAQIDNVATVYAWPRAFLQAQFDTVFSDGDSRVYHR